MCNCRNFRSSEQKSRLNHKKESHSPSFDYWIWPRLQTQNPLEQRPGPRRKGLWTCQPFKDVQTRKIHEEGRKGLMVGCLFPFIFRLAANLRMRRTDSVAGSILFGVCVIQSYRISRSCRGSVTFHGCLLDLGTCKTKAGQYWIKERPVKGGTQWYIIKGCLEDTSECLREHK